MILRMRSAILAISIFFSAILFIDGISVLSQMKNSSGGNLSNNVNQGGMRRLNDSRTTPANVPVNILILGLDEEETRADVIILLNFDPRKGKVNLLSIARDTRTSIDGRIVKINSLTGMGGERLMIENVEELTGLPVNYYVTLNFAGFRNIIDTLGGVIVDVPFEMDYDDPEQNLHIHLKKGRQLLDGKKAEQFVRYRKGNRAGEGYIDGDIGRIRMQQELIKALFEQKVRMKYISKADDIFYILKKYMKSNIETSDVSYYIKYLKNIKSSDMNVFTLPGESAYIRGIWYFICDRQKMRALIDDNFFK